MPTLDYVNFYLSNLKVGDRVLVPMGDEYPCADVYSGSTKLSGYPLSVISAEVTQVLEDEFTTHIGDGSGEYEEEWSWDRHLTPEKWDVVKQHLNLYLTIPEEEVVDEVLDFIDSPDDE
jgi:hypothetical protein